MSQLEGEIVLKKGTTDPECGNSMEDRLKRVKESPEENR